MDSMSPKSAELTQIARNQLRSEMISPHRSGSSRGGIVGRSIRFVFNVIPNLVRFRLTGSKSATVTRGRRAKV